MDVHQLSLKPGPGHQPLVSKDTRTSDGAIGLMVTHCWQGGLSILHLQLERSWRNKLGQSWIFGVSWVTEWTEDAGGQKLPETTPRDRCAHFPSQPQANRLGSGFD